VFVGFWPEAKASGIKITSGNNDGATGHGWESKDQVGMTIKDRRKRVEPVGTSGHWARAARTPAASWCQ